MKGALPLQAFCTRQVTPRLHMNFKKLGDEQGSVEAEGQSLTAVTLLQVILLSFSL